jgi:Domain of unknown function (DUF5664)
MSEPEQQVPAGGIGDVNSDAKGSGARYNAGKPNLHLIPLGLLAAHAGARTETVGYALALRYLGDYQALQDVRHLYAAIDNLASTAGSVAAVWAECADVFTYGLKKYAAWNWAKGMPWSVPLACAGRHLLAILAGEETDAESGLPHRGHVMCNIVMLLQYAKTYPEGNDLPPKGLL